MGTVTDRWTLPSALDFTTNQDITEQNLDDIVSNELFLYNRIPNAAVATGVNATTTSTSFVATGLTTTLTFTPPASGARAYRIIALAMGSVSGVAACVGISIAGGGVQGGPQTGAAGYCMSAVAAGITANSVPVTVYLRSTNGTSVSFDTSFQLVVIALPM